MRGERRAQQNRILLSADVPLRRPAELGLGFGKKVAAQARTNSQPILS